MIEEQTIQQLKLLIAQDQIPSVIEQLIRHAPSLNKQHQNTILLLSNRWKKLNTENNQGIIAKADYQLAYNQISANILDLLNALQASLKEGNVASSTSTTVQEKTSIPWMKMVTTIAAIAAFLAAVAEFTGYSLRDWWEPTDEPITQNTIVNDSTDSTKLAPQVIDPPEKKEPIPSSNQTSRTKNTILTKTSTSENTKEDLPPAKKKLKLQVKTNKGNNNLVFHKNEEVRLFFQVNRPCTLRIIYKLADGTLILLDDDRLVNTPEINRWIELGDGFEVTAPFGEEELYVFAQEQAFPKLVVEEVDGYTHIKEGLPKALSKTRGLKKKNVFAEYRLLINTKE